MCAGEKFDNPTRIVVLSECGERRTSPRPPSETVSRTRKLNPAARPPCHPPFHRPASASRLRGQAPSNGAFLIAKPFRVHPQLTSCGFNKIDFSNRQNSVIRRTHSSPSFSSLRHLASSLQNLPGTVNRVETQLTQRKQTTACRPTRNFAIASAVRAGVLEIAGKIVRAILPSSVRWSQAASRRRLHRAAAMGYKRAAGRELRNGLARRHVRVTFGPIFVCVHPCGGGSSVIFRTFRWGGFA
jgi:hypothetical protein